MNGIKISVVVPFYNEQDLVGEFCERTDSVLKKLSPNYEILAVDDGSHDNTSAILGQLTAKFPKLRVLTLAKNRGQSTAIAAGIKNSRGEYVVIMDGDLQHLPEEIPLFVDKMEQGFDLVSGRRQGRKESLLLRRIPSFFANVLLKTATKTPASDMGGFKCIRGDLLRKIQIRPGYHRFFPALINMMGGTVTEVPISAPKRQKGKSKYGLSRSIDVFLDILMLWFESSFRSRPLYLLGRISAFMFVFASAIFVWLLYEKLFWGYPMAIRPPFMISILLFVLSFLFFFQAITLELISRMLHKLLGIDNYVIKETHAVDDHREKP
jgi:glycosyltransferase involved in cell wall biosynthesis